MEECSCRKTVMTLYMRLVEMSNAKGFHPKINFLSLKHMFGGAAANVNVKRVRAAGLCRRENRATYAFTSAL